MVTSEYFVSPGRNDLAEFCIKILVISADILDEDHVIAILNYIVALIERRADNIVGQSIGREFKNKLSLVLVNVENIELKPFKIRRGKIIGDIKGAVVCIGRTGRNTGGSG